MNRVIDRRLNGKNKSAVNRRRFIRRFRQQIREAVADAISERSITDIDSGEKINIPARDIGEPTFRHGPGGEREAVYPGNTEYVTGDKIKRPQEDGGAGGSQASNSGEGIDDFAFKLSREEFLEFFFDDLALPDLVKTQIATQIEFKRVRSGYSRTGIPANINVIRSLKGALSRRIALRSPLEQRLLELRQELDQQQAAGDAGAQARRAELEEEIRRVSARINVIPFIDTFDLRYNNRIRQPRPTTQAVMFCLMDVSGSMDEERKDIAKRFFILLYLFLTRTYERIEVVFIRHHTSAKEVDEEEFFHSRETGGTVVSSALELMHKIITERYPGSLWNIYAAQASDGDNWNDDSPLCRNLLIEKIMPLLQYFAYVEIKPDEHQSLWREYLHVKARCANFAQQRIDGLTDIYPVFRKLFRKKAAA
ncbi:MAG: YeaH/YhbH family protein [Gammaproteobacteria bacterium]|nr:YeaH/YhbH family protein [Gammaproteobacteria bacterium]